jgi:hypothetical protein
MGGASSNASSASVRLSATGPASAFPCWGMLHWRSQWHARAARRCLLATACAVLLPGVARALVNPQFQPTQHVLPLYRTVASGTITTIDEDKGLVVFEVDRVAVGEFAPRNVAIRVGEVDFDTPSLLDDASEGGRIVAFVGNRRRGREGQLLLYLDRQWHDAHVADPADPATWTWTEALGDRMVGTFNGAADQLLRLVEDAAAGRDFFPAVPLVTFREPIELARFPGPVRGVALYDVTGDGRLDVYACHEEGCRLLVQTGPLRFEDRTEPFGLSGVAGRSVSFADANADGRSDLLVDGVIYLGSGDGFRRSDLLPRDAARDVLSAAFVEINGDGYPDVVVSRVRGGLAVYLNPGPRGGPLIDATAAARLDRPECGAGGTAFFAPGDFSGNGRTDLYYGAGRGFILLQDEQGRFAPMAHRLPFDDATPERQGGLTGGGSFAPLWKPESWDLVAAADMHMVIATRENGRARNVTGLGNETRVTRVNQLATLAEDLNMNGHADLLTLTRSERTANIFHANRGYGSFMCSELYMDYDGLPEAAFSVGAWGAAAGDATGDGTNDLLLGGMDGVLRLCPNDARTHPLRAPKEHPTTLQQRLQEMRSVSVRVVGRIGVLGAEVLLADAEGRVVGRRVIGSAVLTGCRGPDTVNLVARPPGRYRLTVRFSDGATHTRDLELGAEPRVEVAIEYGRGSSDSLGRSGPVPCPG